MTGIPRLNQSPVSFAESSHRYTIGTKALSGITGLIKDVLLLGYRSEDTAPIVWDYYIPRAAEYGKSVHRAIEAWDTAGMEATTYTKAEAFRKTRSDDRWDVSRELANYRRITADLRPIANEYLVSDCRRYATAIDNVYVHKATGEIVLGDTKTNNLKYYHGGIPGLKEYLSWQLSVEAYLFELQNPGLKVGSLVAHWLREDECRQWDIPRKPDDMVKALLSVPWWYDGRKRKMVYDGEDAAKRIAAMRGELELSDCRQIAPARLVRAVYDMEREERERRATHAQVKDRLRAAMEDAGVKTWDAGLFRATIANDSEVEKFDVAAFREDHPDLYEKYAKKTNRKGAFTITLRPTDKVKNNQKKSNPDE